jgi:spermidine synthase
LTAGAATDRRVRVEIGNVADLVRKTAKSAAVAKFDAIVFDLYKGPHHRTDKLKDPLYGRRAIENVRSSLKLGGVFTVWGENYDEGFDKRLCSAGFTVRHERPGRGGFRHVVFLATLAKGSTVQASGQRKSKT